MKTTEETTIELSELIFQNAVQTVTAETLEDFETCIKLQDDLDNILSVYQNLLFLFGDVVQDPELPLSMHKDIVQQLRDCPEYIKSIKNKD
jgi:hypothetical protein